MAEWQKVFDTELTLELVVLNCMRDGVDVICEDCRLSEMALQSMLSATEYNLATTQMHIILTL